MGRSVSARPASDEKESPGKEKPDAKPEDEKPDEKRERPSFRPSKQDPFYLGLRLDVRKARQAARREIDNARRRRRRAADPDLRDKCRVQSSGLSLQGYRAMLERQGKVCGICKTPGKPFCVDHCHATGKVRGLLCRDCNLGLGNYKDNPVFTRAATAYLEASRCDDGNHQGAPGEGSIRFHDLVFGMRRRGMRAEAWKLQIQRLFSWILRSGGKSQGNLQENSGPATCPLQACRPNCS
jgi:hypothetical protein